MDVGAGQTGEKKRERKRERERERELADTVRWILTRYAITWNRTAVDPVVRANPARWFLIARPTISLYREISRWIN